MDKLRKKLATDSLIDVPDMPRPEGGESSGYGESFRLDTVTGAAQLELPLNLPAARALTPSLALRYGSGGSNSLFGFGFSLELPAIARRATLSLPRYTAEDEFVTETGEVLVPRYQREGEKWVPLQRTVVEGDRTYVVQAYQRRFEGSFDRIEQWVDQGDGTSFWMVTGQTNVSLVYGRTAGARISNPAFPERIYRWMAEEQSDTRGNRVVYTYCRDADPTVASLYPASVQYGNFRQGGGEESFAFTLEFRYSDAPRPDVYESFRPGFELRTARLCTELAVSHHFPEQFGGDALVVGLIRMEHEVSGGVSRLTALHRMGRRRADDGTIEERALPPIRFTYSAWTPHEAEFAPVDAEGVHRLPSLAAKSNLRFVDLYGDGLPGVLDEQPEGGGAPVYWRPLGGGRYAAPELLPIAPVTTLQALGRTALLDLSGEGKRDSVVLSAGRAGYYENRNGGEWGPFRALESAPTDLDYPSGTFVDLNGGGRADYLDAGPGEWRTSETQGRAGFGPMISRPPPEGIERYLSDAEDQLLGFVDVFGDGLSHLVALSSGHLRVWPSLGYGKFGAPRDIPGLPVFDAAVTQRDLLFANLTGIGGADLVVVMGDRVAVYLNHWGQSFSFVREVKLPAAYGALDLAQTVDLLGLGTTQIVVGFSSGRGGTSSLDLSCGRRPFLLTGIDNGMGLTTKVAYRSSVDYSLADRAQGKPWATSLPFPVSVVAQIDQDDAVSRTQMVRVAQYADGYFDPVDRQFAGFGYVQMQDSLTVGTEVWRFPSLTREEHRATTASGPVAPGVVPLFTRSWHQVGSFEQAEVLRARMLEDGYHGEGDALTLPGSHFSAEFATVNEATLRLAYVALLGRPLRDERYSVGANGAVGAVPYSVSQYAYGIVLVQPAVNGHQAVLMVTDRETAIASYEQRADDPFWTHDLNVELDPFGQAVRSVQIGYARRNAAGRERLPGQTEAAMRLQTRGFINHTDGAYRNTNGGTTPVDDALTGGLMHVVGLSFEKQSFEIEGFNQPAPFFTYEGVRSIVQAAMDHVVAFGVPLTPGRTEARLFNWRQSYFWDDGQTGSTLQRTGPQQLPYQDRDATFSDAFVAEVFAGRVDSAYLMDRGGYSRDEGYYWATGQTVTYHGAPLFYLPTTYVDPFGAKTTVFFDAYQLMLERKVDALGYAVSASYDYQALQPKRTIDENENVEETLYDALGEVLIQTRFGTERGVAVGDLPASEYVRVPARSAQEVLNDPWKYLQGAGAYYYYDLDAWNGSPALPVFTIELQRRTFVRPGDDAPPNARDLAIRLRYFDGLTRQLTSVVLVSGVPPFSLYGDATPRLTAEVAAATGADGPTTRWLITEQERFDDRGDAIVRYQPYFADVPAYVERPSAPSWRIRYDALNRELETETPKGFLTSKEYLAWSTALWDEDDTVMRSPYYEKHIHDPELPPAERAALQMAARLANTPVVTDKDVLGRDIRVSTLLVPGTESEDPPPPRPLHTISWYDALDKVCAYADPRFYDAGDPAHPRYFNAFIRYDMRGRPAWQKGADAGNEPLRQPSDGLPCLRLFDAVDGMIDEWDRRGFRISVDYNELRLPTGSRVRGDGIDALTERIVYGSAASDNTVNRIVEHDDGAGVERIGLYSILGDAISLSRQFLVSAQGAVDWTNPTKPPLQPTVWSWRNERDATGQLVRYQAPNGAVLTTGYTANGWPLLAKLGDTSESTVVASVTSFSPSGRPATTSLGNGFTVGRAYDPEMLRLLRIRAFDGQGSERQDIAYTYDPVGNVTNLANRVPAGGEPAPVNSVYRYDSVYRLLTATGRRQTDAAGSPIEPYSRSYTYDDSGNLLAITDDAGARWSRRYVVSPSANHAVTEAMAEAREPDAYFDADGMMIALPDGTALIHNPAGRLSRAEGVAGGVSLFQYASSGVRMRKKTAHGETYYLAPFLSEGDPAAAAELMVWLGDQRMAMARYPAAGSALSAPALCYQLDDRLHSVVEQTSAEGKTLDVQEFYPYGATAIYLPSTGLTEDEKRYQFTGQERDPSTGLYSFAARYYSPDLAHWIAPDPAGTADGLNLFAYVRGNPLTLADPTGEGGDDDNQPKQGSGSLDVKKSLKLINKGGVFANVVGEIVTGPFHGTTLDVLKHHGPNVAALYTKFASLAAFGALSGGFAGGIYSGLDIRKNGANFFNVTSLGGQIAFSYEGFKLYQSFLVKDAHALHLAHSRIGYIGFIADTLKIPYYVKNRDYGEALFYSGLAVGNLRAGVGDEATRRFFQRVVSGIVTPYNSTSFGLKYPISAGVSASLPTLLSAPKGYQILAATITAKLFFTLFTSNKKND
jgi:RHS repeat-associated protein